MRLSTFTTAVAAAALFVPSIAKPTLLPDRWNEKAPEQHTEKVKRDDSRKYFHEPGGDEQHGHYDIRYYHGIVSDEERTDTQTHMIRAYLEFFRENGLDTWIAHGTLLGWWWNGKRLPWDTDLDTQVSGATLQHLGDVYNQTKHTYTSFDGKTQREYLLDVGSMIWERVRGDGMNVIDARWIDTSNGLFIDITGLSETHPDTKPGVWSCKNNHGYNTADLYPMRETMFEGVMAKVPYEYDKILVAEYKETALVNTDFHGHRWNPERKEWEQTQEDKDRIEREREEKEEEEKKKAEEQAQVA